jgi:hypothetical protein
MPTSNLYVLTVQLSCLWLHRDLNEKIEPMPVVTWSKAWVCAAHLLGLRVRIPLEVWMSVSCECCVLSGRGLCDGSIARPEEAYRVWSRAKINFYTYRGQTKKEKNKERKIKYYKQKCSLLSIFPNSGKQLRNFKTWSISIVQMMST